MFRLDKVLYGLKQAPKARYDTLINFLIEKEFTRGMFGSLLYLTTRKPNIMFPTLC